MTIIPDRDLTKLDGKTMPSGAFGGTETMTAFEHWVEAHRVDDECLPLSKLGYDINALSAEVGELQSQLKTMYRDGFDGEERYLDHIHAGARDVLLNRYRMDREKILLEAGDILHYLSRVLNDIGSDFEECANANIEKLTNRMNYGKGQKGLRS